MTTWKVRRLITNFPGVFMVDEGVRTNTKIYRNSVVFRLPKGVEKNPIYL